ncbi:MAG: hypothetical protein OHK0052_00170 [Anaerolineales bacterium]
MFKKPFYRSPAMAIRTDRSAPSVQTNIVVATVLLVSLTLLSAVVGSLAIGQLRRVGIETLGQASIIRESALTIETQFLRARQSESDFLNSWRTQGFDAAFSTSAVQNAESMKKAMQTLQALQDTLNSAETPLFGALQTDVNALAPLLNEYNQVFERTVSAVERRTQPTGVERNLISSLDTLENTIRALDRPDLLEMVLRIRINQNAYNSTYRQEYVDNITILLNKLTEQVRSLPIESFTGGGSSASSEAVIVSVERYRTTFRELFNLDREIENSSTISRELTLAISARVNVVNTQSEQALTRANKRVEEITVRSLLLLGGIAGLMMLAGVLISFSLGRGIVTPLTALTQSAEALGAGRFDQPIKLRAAREFNQLAQTFNTMSSQLRQNLTSLESRVQERTRALERRNAQIRTAAEIVRDVAGSQTPEEMLQRIADLTRERFGFYFVGIYLADENRKDAHLRAATGEAGQAMLADATRIRILSSQLVGRAIQQSRPILRSTAENYPNTPNTNLLPLTRSQLALPLKLADHTLGALDLHSDKQSAFDEDDIAVLQTLADQLAALLENLRLVNETQNSLATLRRVFRERGQQAWREMLETRPAWGYSATSLDIVAPTTEDWTRDMYQSLQSGRIVQSDAFTLILPVILRDQIAGVLRARKSEDSPEWRPEELELLQALINQMNLALENARLYADTQRLAVREKLLGDAAAQMRQTLDVDTVLRTALLELRHALGLTKVEVRLGKPEQTTAPQG